jgi:hypothetical protein
VRLSFDASSFVIVEIDRNQTLTEYREKYNPWEVEKVEFSPASDPAHLLQSLPFRPPNSNPIGISTDAIPSSEWKSFAQQTMEDTIQATRESSGVPEEKMPRHNTEPPPPNYAWPQYSDQDSRKQRAGYDLRHENTEYQENYQAWDLVKVISKQSLELIALQAPRSHPLPTNPIGVSPEAIESSDWKSHAKQITEETLRAQAQRDLLRGEGQNDSKVAGVKTSGSGGAPANYAWPTAPGDRTHQTITLDVDSLVNDSRHKLKFDTDIHTEYRDNYLQWAIEKVPFPLYHSQPHSHLDYRP